MAQTSAQFVVPCTELEQTIDWFTDVAGFRMLMLRPADDPAVAVVAGYGIEVRLDRTMTPGPTGLRIPVEELPADKTLIGPNGTVVEFVLADPPDHLPENRPTFVINRASDGEFGEGRAGMLYRDLIPERHGGRYIASHINIPVGGPVPDYVHHHHIRFQMIFCNTGWAELVYEDQGTPFRFEAGDCVLQPPHIRHRVLETSDEFEVVEISSPAVHDTLRDHDLELPTTVVDHDRDFGGQRFVRHRAANAPTTPWRFDGFSTADFGIGTATDGLARVSTVRSEGAQSVPEHVVADEFTFWFVRSGQATLHRKTAQHQNGEAHRLGARDSVVLAPGERYALTDVSNDYEFLEVTVPH